MSFSRLSCSDVLFLAISITIILLHVNAHSSMSEESMDFTLWGNVLKKCIESDKKINGISLNEFNYTCLRNNKDFIVFGSILLNAKSNFTNYDDFKAFWINTYNYLAVKTVYHNTCANDMFGSCKPLSSIREIGQQQPSLFVNSVWDEKTLVIKSHNNAMPISLNDIEIGLLRNPPSPWKEDPRIHSCLNCCSVSCPDLQPFAFNTTCSTTSLDQQMDMAMTKWLANPKKGSALINNDLYVSKIFAFFPEDFNSTMKHTEAKNIYSFIKKYAPNDIQDFLETHPRPSLYYFDYDWNLNGNINSLCDVNRPCFPWWALIIILILLAIIIFIIIIIRYRFTHKRVPYDPLYSAMYE